MTFKECVEEGLIRKTESAREKIGQSILLGDKFLNGAEKNFGIGEFEVCEIISYNSLFHYARALLFSKGFLERSHACLFVALKELYPGNEDLFNEADRMRRERHNLQYGGFAAGKESAAYFLKFVKSFGDATKKMLKNKGV